MKPRSAAQNLNGCFGHRRILARGRTLKGSSQHDMKVSLLALLIVSMAGCATTPKGRPVPLDFLIDGNTTEAQVFAKFGKPSAAFEGGKILTYRLGFDARCG